MIKKLRTVRVVEGGGSKYLAADVNADTLAIGPIITPNAPINDVERLIAFCAADLPPSNIGFAMPHPGEIDEKRGIIRKVPNRPYIKNLRLRQRLARTFPNRPILVMNDMKSVGKAVEYYFPNLEMAHVDTWSSGLGGALVVKGKIILTSELSHNCLDPSPSAWPCGCGRRGCYETKLGGKQLIRHIVVERDIRGLPRLPDDRHPMAYLDEAYKAREPWALAIYDMIVEAMGRYVAMIVTTHLVYDIVWKGGTAMQSFRLPNIQERVIQTASRTCYLDSLTKKLQFHFMPNEPPDCDSFIGAAMLVAEAANDGNTP